ncbi:SH3 domain-containing protein [Vibrio parahaemolyticus]|nr:SH3 domain-containing protein [Vibrio parahaemolyticus]
MKPLTFLCLVLFSASLLGQEKDMYVIADALNVRLEPSQTGKITNTLYRGQKVAVLEISSGWARISLFYDGDIERVSGKVARWVSYSYLSSNKPSRRAKSSSRLQSALSSSDDYSKYKDVFLDKSQVLIKMGYCNVGDFEKVGGWVRSVNYKPRRVYFTYCGTQSHVSGRIYLDVISGKIFQ